LVGLGYPVLLGAPSPTFVDEILEAAGHPAGPSGRDAAEMAAVALAVASGVAVMRVHDVAGALQVARTADAIVQSSIPGV
jgi:dihydropteroate synthase